MMVVCVRPRLLYHVLQSQRLCTVVFTMQRFAVDAVVRCPSVHPSVCLSRGVIVLKRFNLRDGHYTTG